QQGKEVTAQPGTAPGSWTHPGLYSVTHKGLKAEHRLFLTPAGWQNKARGESANPGHPTRGHRVRPRTQGVHTMEGGVRNGKIRVGVVGVGGISRDQHLPGWAQVPFAEVAALSDVSQEALARGGQLAGVPATRQFRDWHDLVALEELDVVDICTPNQTHAP